MNEDVQTQRTFLLAIGGALAVFAMLLFVWGAMKAPDIVYADQPDQIGDPKDPSPSGAGYQDIYLKALSNGKYDKPTVTVKKGIPVRLHFSAESGAGCGRALVMRDFGVSLVSKNGEEQVATFTPTKTGTFEYSCSMRMFVGKMTVTA